MRCYKIEMNGKEEFMWVTFKTDILIHVVDPNLLRLRFWHCYCSDMIKELGANSPFSSVEISLSFTLRLDRRNLERFNFLCLNHKSRGRGLEERDLKGVAPLILLMIKSLQKWKSFKGEWFFSSYPFLSFLNKQGKSFLLFSLIPFPFFPSNFLLFLFLLNSYKKLCKKKKEKSSPVFCCHLLINMILCQ